MKADVSQDSSRSNEIPKLEFRSVTKKFGNFYANRQVSFKVNRGSIHAILGENGAGKSTAMKILYGMQAPDAGCLVLDGKEVRLRSPQDAIARGIGMIHQHFMLSEKDSALDNLILGSEPWSIIQGIERSQATQIFEDLCQKHALQVRYHERIERMSVGERQRIEILKAVYRKSEVLILDEPTAVLSPKEIVFLFEYLKALKAQGKTILIITHKLKEVLEHADAVTVLKNGTVSAAFKVGGLSFEDLAKAMIGRDWKPVQAEISDRKDLRPVLKVDKLTVTRGARYQALAGVSFQVCSGQIVGIAGVEGNGQGELLRSLTGLLKTNEKTQGLAQFLELDLLKSETQDILNKGMSYIPEDRQGCGLVLDATIEENLMLGQTGRYSWYGFIRSKWLRSAAKRVIHDFAIKPDQPDALLRAASGGNQQKVVFARELERSPKLLLIAQPTRGVDLGAVQVIHERILDAKQKGAAILLVSSELDELLSLADELYVMSEGRFVGHHVRGQFNMDNLAYQMGGIETTHSGARV